MIVTMKRFHDVGKQIYTIESSRGPTEISPGGRSRASNRLDKFSLQFVRWKPKVEV